ncbi:MULTISPECIES: TonB-dependent receptor [Stenotrophomonas]|uniref:TonB-dependent receptor domain-containing protein n=1 Tax=Stenotrophomonas TaxID=40323 RepID=UPI00201CEC71|nr:MULTISPECIES: TonB-dependent receptor [Stenotrophomonas]MBN5024347.1 TonB-dependent receptor [Stenotrophomonas maltophilia]MDH1483449.1 TonB-dependent receptor [Stenotrophomonas sp. GD03712]UQY96534.1 TonB-dependent receptor [Stenotrophomonas maltophilia]WON66829.1 TonB-dependent receptor [Stenotrophomonas maltophilia]HDS1101787.1 TonB-dependent receptor [Stenotrophomonas maltophilia]
MTRPVPPAALRRLAPALLAACLCAALPVAAQTRAPATVELHLPAGPLQASLNALARQSGIQLLFAADSTRGRSAPALEGRYTPRDALQRLLAGHALTLQERSPGVFVVSAAAAPAPAPAKASAPAQATPAAGPTSLARVTVSASTARMPQGETAMPNTITVLTREDIAQQLALGSDVSRVLSAQIPAFAPAREKMSNYGESMRGRGILYMVDGVPQSTPLRDGSRDSHTIDPAMIERIEVIHGANALQGIGGTGGIVNIITRSAPTEPGAFLLDSNLTYSSALPNRHDDNGQRASALVGVRGDRFDLVAGLAYERQGLFHDGEGRSIGTNAQGELMDSTSSNVFAKLGWNLAEGHRLQVMANRYELRGLDNYVAVNGDFRTGRPTLSVPGDTPLDPPMNRSRSLTVDYSAADLLGGRFQAQAFAVDFEGRYGASQWDPWGNTGANAAWDQTQNESDKRGFKLTQSWTRIADTPLDVTVGLDGLRDRTHQVLLASGMNWVPLTTYQSLSPLLQLHWWPTDHLMLSGGLRYEKGELEVGDYTTLPRYGARKVAGGKPTMSETLPNIGAVWYINDRLNAYASYSEGYTVADVGRVLRAINRDGQRVDNLVDLSPVVSDNREIGLEYDDGRFSGDIAYYTSESKLGSVLVYDAGIDAYNVQRQATRVEGFESNLRVRLGDARLGLGYARANGRYDANVDGRLDSDLAGVNIAPNRLTAFWEQNWTPQLSTRLQASHAFDRDFDQLGNRVATFNGYTTMDLVARYALDKHSFTLGVQNLANKQYISYYSQTTPSNPSYFAGRGRVLSLGWQYRY